MRGLITLLLLVLISVPSPAQKRSKKESHKVTPETAMDKEAKNKEAKEAKYVSAKDHHKKVQDKETRKRMKKTLKKAEKQSWGKDIPWYRRWFLRRKV